MASWPACFSAVCINRSQSSAIQLWLCIYVFCSFIFSIRTTIGQWPEKKKSLRWNESADREFFSYNSTRQSPWQQGNFIKALNVYINKILRLNYFFSFFFFKSWPANLFFPKSTGTNWKWFDFSPLLSLSFLFFSCSIINCDYVFFF